MYFIQSLISELLHYVRWLYGLIGQSSIPGISKILHFRRHTQTYSNVFPAISKRLECENDHSFASNIDNKLGGAVVQLLHLLLLLLEKILCVTLPKHCFIAWPCCFLLETPDNIFNMHVWEYLDLGAKRLLRLFLTLIIRSPLKRRSNYER